MKHLTVPIACAAVSTFVATAALAQQADTDAVTRADALLANVVLTDAIRVEVGPEAQDHCAITVIRAFNLPHGSLSYGPSCAVIDQPQPYTSARND